MFGQTVKRFFVWYERHYTINVGLAAGLFVLQLIHLYWLTTGVVFWRIFGRSFFDLSGVWQYLIIVVDYTEIPALITTSLVYINDLRKQFNPKSVWFLIFLNSQWLHLFWVTDEFVVSQFKGTAGTVLPFWLAWLAIMIDYLELPVIFDTFKKFLVVLKRTIISQ